MFCKHEWKILSDQIVKNTMKDRVTAKNHAPGHMLDFIETLKDTHIQVISCNKCGKLKRYVTKV